MIGSGVLGFTVLLLVAGSVFMSCAAAFAVIHNRNEFGRWAGFGLGVIALMFTIPLIVIVSKIAGTI